MKLTLEEKRDILENAISWVVVMAMMVYGLGKITQFGNLHQENKTVSELSGMELMWVFYAYSKPYALTIGFFEVLGGLLMILKKTRLIGCFLVSAILVNVILQDIFYGVLVGALKAALFYQSLILIVLWLNRKKILEGFKVLMTNKQLNRTYKQKMLHFSLIFLLFILFRIVECFWTMFVF
jgi:hypothetical protein